MPKKMIEQPKKSVQLTSTSWKQASKQSNNSSIIAEMHYQNGMTSVKEDLLRKIQNYQSILKKSHTDKPQAIKAQARQSTFEYPRSSVGEEDFSSTRSKAENLNTLKQKF